MQKAKGFDVPNHRGTTEAGDGERREEERRMQEERLKSKGYVHVSVEEREKTWTIPE